MKEIQNIFSKKKIKEKLPPKTEIIIDTREKNSMIHANLIELKANVKKEKLDIGDYQINNIVLERKTISDFLNSLYSKRLFEQISNLKKYEKRAIILEGDLRDTPEERINSLKGMLLSIKLNHQIPIIQTQNEKDTAKKLLDIARQQEKKKIFSIRKSRTEKTIEEQKQFILEGFPEIGPTKARRLINKHQTLKKIFNLTEKELLETIDEIAIKKFLKLLESKD